MSRLVAGIDEVGRGALAGPVVAAVVVLDPSVEPIRGLDDSKQLAPRRREQLTGVIVSRALAWAVGRAEASEIDQLNILQASLLAMKRAFAALVIEVDWVRVDGRHFPDLNCSGEAVVGGDAIYPEIMAASILAKVSRDREMAILDVLTPGYYFDRHKGYPTAAHRAQIERNGPCFSHRMSFGPLGSYLRCPGGFSGGTFPRPSAAGK